MARKAASASRLLVPVIIAAVTGSGEAARASFGAARQTREAVLSAENTDATRIVAGESSGAPGAEAVVPISLAAAEGARVGTIAVRLGFLKALLGFDSIEPSGNALAVDATVTATVKPGPDADTTVLHVRVTTVVPAGKRQAIPSGPVAYITFKIAKDAKPGLSIALMHEAEVSTTDDPARPIAPVVASKAEIQVTVPPITGCFFYMH